LEARVIVKVEMRTQLAGVKATPAHKGPDSPWGLQRATLMFLLTIDFNLVFLLYPELFIYKTNINKTDNNKS